MSLDRSLDLILAHEGGFVDHPADRGGATRYGITQATLDHASRHVLGLPQNVRQLSRDEARLIYAELYWRPCGADSLPWPTNYVQMDAAVQHGVRRAAMWLQEELGLVADGIVGPITRAAARGVVGWGMITARLLARRALYYVRILADPSQAVFARGWANRMDAVVRLAHEGGAVAPELREEVARTLGFIRAAETQALKIQTMLGEE